jgi:hypothetical protein
MSNENTNLIQYSLITLLNSEEIKDVRIPVIQRDFAYGREEEADKRNRLIDKLYNHLIPNEPIPYILNFVYGKFDADKNFYPIDGQQRLTTLYLLHLYLAKKEKTKQEFSKLEYLKKFHYESRRNSEDFCSYLFYEDLDFSVKNLKDFIQNRSWFRNIWNNDATVSAMLVMLQAIHEKFKNTEEIYKKLTIPMEKTISFYFLDLGKKDFELTDELYIKMNARGKQLSNFENYKASFIDFLENKYPSKKNYFTKKIESDWTDLFWGYRIDEEHFDERMLNFFDFFSELSFFKNHPDAKSEDYNIRNIGEIFLSEDDVTLLYDSLDWLYNLCDKNENKEIIAKQIDGSFKGKIDLFLENTFDDSNCKLLWDSERNIFIDILNNGLDVQSQSLILFYELLKYVTKHKLQNPTDALLKHLRLIRNLLAASLQLNEDTYNTNIRLNYFGNYERLFSKLDMPYEELITKNFDLTGSRITKESFEHEREKIKLVIEKKIDYNVILELENLPMFEGLIHNLQLDLNYEKASDYLSAIKQIWSKNVKNRYINMALVACGFLGLYIRNCNNGCWENYFFGTKSNWKTIFVYNKTGDNQNNIRNSIHTLLDLFLSTIGENPEDKLKTIINSKLKNYQNSTWEYYFMKYADMFAIPGYMNYFAWISNNFEIESLKYASSNPTSGKHINPYVYLVCMKINDDKICNLESCKIQHGEYSKLVLPKGKELECMEDGWRIRKTSITDAQLINKYAMTSKEDYYYFRETKDADRIEIAFNFVKDLLNL